MKPTPVSASDIPATQGSTIYPEPYAARVGGRTKRKLGQHFGLNNFGVNHTVLEPGAESALLHFHDRQDEFIYILEGNPTLRIGRNTHQLAPGDCFGFRAGVRDGHQLVNRSEARAVYLEIGDRTNFDEVHYPEDDLKARGMSDGSWVLTHKDDTPY